MSRNFKPIIIVAGEPKSIFFEIFFKTIKSIKVKSPLVLIASHNILSRHIKKINFKRNINLLKLKNLQNNKLNNKNINLIDITLKTKFNKVSKANLNIYLEKSFNTAFRLIKSGFTNKLINGPINKKKFLRNKFLGITELISIKFNTKKYAMLIYNKELSVCPITTHLPLKLVAKNISKKLICEKVQLIEDFYKCHLGFKPKIAVTGLNPHCESVLQFNEDDKIIAPSVKYLQKKGIKIKGPFPADTIFLKQNRKKFNVIVGMYHDQVLTPIKTLKEYDAINITLGLPFLRVSPDHGPNEKMINKNISNPSSLIKAIKFLDKK